MDADTRNLYDIMSTAAQMKNKDDKESVMSYADYIRKHKNVDFSHPKIKKLIEAQSKTKSEPSPDAPSKRAGKPPTKKSEASTGVSAKKAAVPKQTTKKQKTFDKKHTARLIKYVHQVNAEKDLAEKSKLITEALEWTRTANPDPNAKVLKGAAAAIKALEMSVDWGIDLIKKGADLTPALVTMIITHCPVDFVRKVFEAKNVSVDVMMSIPGVGDAWTPLMYSIYARRPELVELFIELGANMNTQTPPNLRSAISLCCTGDTEYDNKAARQEMGKILIDAGCDLSLRDASTATPLQMAVRNGDERLVLQMILSKQFQSDPSLINQPNQEGKTALFIAAELGNEKITRHLLNGGADQRFADTVDTPASIAVKKNHMEVVNLLLASNPCYIDSVSPEKKSLFQVAASEEMRNLLLAHKEKWSQEKIMAREMHAAVLQGVKEGRAFKNIS